MFCKSLCPGKRHGRIDLGERLHKPIPVVAKWSSFLYTVAVQDIQVILRDPARIDAVVGTLVVYGIELRQNRESRLTVA